MKLTNENKEIELSAEEEALLKSVRKMFESKDDYGSGATFRIAFVSAIMEGYCDHCGRGGENFCYCWNDE